MAKKVTKTTRKPPVSKKVSKITDLKYIRPEVLDFSKIKTEKQRQDAIRDTLNFNNYFNTYKEGIEWLDAWAKKNLPVSDYRNFKKAEDWNATITVCTLAKLVNAGCDIGEKNVAFLRRKVDELVKIGARKKEAKAVVGEKAAEPFNANMCKIDEIFDCIADGKDVKSDLTSLTLSPSERAKALSTAKSHLDFATFALKDREYVKGYRFLKNKLARDAYLTQIASVVSNLEQKPRIAVVQRKPRAKKAKPVDAIIAKLRYQPESKEYGIASINPASLVGAKIAILFNTEKRTLTILKSDEGFGVTGTTLTNVNEKESFKKTLRKPNEVLPKFIKTTKAYALKAFDEIKTTAQPGTGRMSEETIIMKVY